jgi:hypothetical protein
MSSEDPNKNNTVKSSFDLKDLMNMGQNPALQQQIQGMMQNQFSQHLNNNNESSENKSLSKEELRKKLRDKIREKENMRMGKSFQEKKQIEQLKQNPMVNAMGDVKNVDVNMLVDQIMRQQNIPNNPQQRKSVKRQVEQLMEKMNK